MQKSNILIYLKYCYTIHLNFLHDCGCGFSTTTYILLYNSFIFFAWLWLRLLYYNIHDETQKYTARLDHFMLFHQIYLNVLIWFHYISPSVLKFTFFMSHSILVLMASSIRVIDIVVFLKNTSQFQFESLVFESPRNFYGSKVHITNGVKRWRVVGGWGTRKSYVITHISLSNILLLTILSKYYLSYRYLRVLYIYWERYT